MVVMANPYSRHASPDLRAWIYRRDRGQCQYCGDEVSLEDCNIDHLIPYPQGATIEENLCVACQPCNKLKGNQRIPDDFLPFVPRDGQTKAERKNWQHTRRLYA